MNLTLRKVTSHPHVTDAYQVMLEGVPVGSIARRDLAYEVVCWQWGIYEFGRIVPGIDGQADTLKEAMAAFRAAWDRIVTPLDIVWMRATTEATETKYRQFDKGDRRAAAIEIEPGKPADRFKRCACGEAFDMQSLVETKVHVPHIKANKKKPSHLEGSPGEV
jgi:hypothetical protein